MILLKLISWQYVRKHLLRTFLTMAGIVLGVAVFVGMHTANQSVLQAFYQTIDRIAGATQLQVSAGETGFEEEVLERVQSAPWVSVAVPVIEAVVQPKDRSQGSLLILGIDMTGDRSLREFELAEGDEAVIEDPLVFLAQADSIIVTRSFASQNGLSAGSKLPLDTMEGEKHFTVRGIMKSGGLTSAFGGNLAIMDIYAAQKVFGYGRRFDRIDIAVSDDVSIADAQTKLQTMLGPGFQVETPSGRGQHFESMSRVYAVSANITSLFALFIGMFIIFNTFSIAVTQRRSEIGILRALGASRNQIRTLFLAESAVLGFAGSLAGIGFGILIARGMAGYIGSLLGEVYGVAQRAEELATDPRLLIASVIIGTLTSLLAAFLPARNAARIDPVQALQKGKYQILTAGENRIRRLLAVVFGGASVACLFLSQYPALFYTGYMLAVVSALLLTPTLAWLLSRALRPVLKAFLPVEGALAADSLIQAPRRTSGTVSALMLSLALVISLAGVAKASYLAIERWLDIALNPDLFVTPSESLTKRQFRFPGSMTEALAKVPGIELVQPVRSARINIDGAPIMMVAINVSTVGSRSRLPAIEGNQEEMYRLTAAGKAIIAAENFSLLRNKHVGDIVEIPTPNGLRRMPIAGVVRDYSDQQGTILLDLKLYREWWRDDTINVFRVYLKPGVSAAQAKQRILETFQDQRRLFVLTNDEVRAYILRITDQWFGLTYIQIFVAVLVAILGIVNTLTVSITDRRREIGVLQAVGGLRNQIRQTIWLEAVAIGIVGLLLGLLLGAAQLYYSLEVSRRDLAGLRLDYTYPFTVAALLLPVITGAALLSAIGPGEAAVRGSLVEALEYE